MINVLDIVWPLAENGPTRVCDMTLNELMRETDRIEEYIVGIEAALDAYAGKIPPDDLVSQLDDAIAWMDTFLEAVSYMMQTTQEQKDNVVCLFSYKLRKGLIREADEHAY